MKKLVIILVLIFLSEICYSQTDTYYYYQGKKVDIEVNHEMFYIVSKDSIALEDIRSKFSSIVTERKSGKNQSKEGMRYWKIIHIEQKSDTLDFKEVKARLENIDDIEVICPVVGNKKPVAVSEYFYVKLKEENDYHLLEKVANEMSCEILEQVKNMPLWFTLKPRNKANALNMANYFYSTSYFKEIDPGFIFEFTNNCINDGEFHLQWGLENSSGPDINACNAWNISQGESSIVVAVLDEGIDASHNEFSTNLLSLSFDAQANSSPSQLHGSHGTHVAGIIGANQNGSQISGVAPSASLMAVSHSLVISSTISQELASGISWAWQNGADIINNSWGDQGGALYNNLQSALLEDAIDNALLNGRNGLGCIIVFASGNESPAIDYPGYYTPEILCVGSIAASGTRSSFSGYGDELDIVAPGGDIHSTLLNNSTGSESGTSMAAPHIAGVAALILSVNSNLTLQEVSDIIEKSAQKISGYSYQTTTGRPNGTWNNEMGYGLVDAYEAVSCANGDGTEFVKTVFSSNTNISECYVNFTNVSVSNSSQLTVDFTHGFEATGTFNAPLGTTLTIAP